MIEYRSAGIIQDVRDYDKSPPSHLFFMPSASALDAGLSLQARALLGFLYSWAASHADRAPSRDEIRTGLGIGSKDAYYRYVSQLTDQGYLEAEQQFVPGQGYRQNVYRLTRPAGAREADNRLALVPKSLFDQRLPAKSIGLYLVLAALAGAEETVLLSPDFIRDHAGVAWESMRGYREELVSRGWLAISRSPEGTLYHLNRLAAF